MPADILSGKPFFYTYIHTRADDGKVFYVGKGKGKRSFTHDGRNPHWKKIVKKHGLKVEIVARWPLESDAFEHETFLISCFREMNHPICNMTDGGEGRSGYLLTEESKRKISQANSGKKRTAEQNRRNSEARIGMIISAEQIAKTRAANTGKVRSAESRANISAGHMGRVNSAEHRAKTGAGNKGRVRSDEFKAKIVAALTGRPCSDETRAKLSAAHKGRVITQEMRDKISKTLTGRKSSEVTKAKLQAIADDPARKARHSAVMKGRPWSEARRKAQEAISRQVPLI